MYGTTGRPELGMTLAMNPTGTAATFTFPPIRDEAGTTMTLTYQLVGNPGAVYVSDVTVPSTDHTNPANIQWTGQASEYPPISSTPIQVQYAGSENMVTYAGLSNPITFQQLLDSATSGANNFELVSPVYDLSTPLYLDHPVTLYGQSRTDTLQFDFTSTPGGVGAINFWQTGTSINYWTSDVTLQDFTIKFSQSDVTMGDAHGAVIEDEDPHQIAKVGINIVGLTIHSPFDSNHINTMQIYNDPLDSGSYVTDYAIYMGPYDSGTIQDNTIYGGTVAVQFGPWTISGNMFPLGSVAGTVSPSAFAVYGGHDVTIENNTVEDPNPAQNGEIYRLMTANYGGYNIQVQGNTVQQGVGILPANGSNAPEEILPESYGITYEGSTLAANVSADPGQPYNGRIVAIPDSELFTTVSSSPLGEAGTLVLFVLDGSSAGTAIPVTQTIADYSASVDYFVLTSAMPSGAFDFAIENAYDVFNVEGNTIDTRGTVSTAVVLNSTFDNVLVQGNTIVGDQTTSTVSANVNQAMRIATSGAQPGVSSLGNFNSTYVSQNPMFNVVVHDNSFENSLAGIRIYTDSGQTEVPTTYGRTYATVQLSDNPFSYNYQNSDVIQIGTAGEYSSFSSGVAVVDPTATTFVDPRQLAVTTLGNTISWDGVSPPATDVEVNAAYVNSTYYDAESMALTTSPPLLNAGSAVQVSLASNLNAVGITYDTNTSPGNIDPGGDSLSAESLGSAASWTSGQPYTWDGQPFALGNPGVADVSQFVGQSITLPQSQYTDLLVLAMAHASVGTQQQATFTVYYTDGTSQTFTQAISDFINGYAAPGYGPVPGTVGPGESIAAVMPYYNNATYGQISKSVYLYGYDFALNPSKTVESLSLSNNNAINLYGLDLAQTNSRSDSATTTATPSTLLSAISASGSAGVFSIDGSGDVSYTPAGGPPTIIAGTAKAVSGVTVNGAPAGFVLETDGNVEFFEQTGGAWNSSLLSPALVAKAISGISAGTVPGVFVLGADGGVDLYTLDGPSWISSSVSGTAAVTAVAGISIGATPAVFTLSPAGLVSEYFQSQGGTTWSSSSLYSAGGQNVTQVSAVDDGVDTGVFALNADGNVSYFTQNGTGWSQSAVTTGLSSDTAISGVAGGPSAAVFALNADGNVGYYTLTGSTWSQSIVTGAGGETSISAIEEGQPPSAQLFALDAGGTVYGYTGSNWGQSEAASGQGYVAISQVPGSSSPAYFERQSNGDVYFYEESGGQMVVFGGLVDSSATAISSVPASSSTNGYPAVFVLNSTGDVYEFVYSSSTGWASFGGLVGTTVTSISAVAATSATNNYPSVFVVNGAGCVFPIMYYATLSPPIWGGYGVYTDAGIDSGFSVTSISGVAATASGDFPSVFTLDWNGNVFYWTYSSGSFNKFGLNVVDVSVIAISASPASTGTGSEPSVFVINGQGNLYDIAYDSYTEYWGGIASVTSSNFIAISASPPANSSSYPLVFALTASGYVDDYHYNTTTTMVLLGNSFGEGVVSLSAMSTSWVLAFSPGISPGTPQYYEYNGTSWVATL